MEHGRVQDTIKSPHFKLWTQKEEKKKKTQSVKLKKNPKPKESNACPVIKRPEKTFSVLYFS